MSKNSSFAGNKTSLSLAELSKSLDLVDYTYYIEAYIKLLTNLCKGRKESHIKTVALG